MERGQQRDVERHALLRLNSRSASLSPLPKTKDWAAPRNDCSAGRRRSVASRRMGIPELASSIPQLLLQDFSPQPFPLPDCKVRILDGQFSQRRSLACGEGFEQDSQFLKQHTHGPPVCNDVMHAEKQDMPLLAQTQQRSAKERAPSQIKRVFRACGNPPANLGVLLAVRNRLKSVNRGSSSGCDSTI